MKTEQEILEKVMVGKTIKSVSYRDCTCLIEFTDGRCIKFQPDDMDAMQILVNADDWTSDISFIRETFWRRENGHDFSQKHIDYIENI